MRYCICKQARTETPKPTPTAAGVCGPCAAKFRCAGKQTARSTVVGSLTSPKSGESGYVYVLLYALLRAVAAPLARRCTISESIASRSYSSPR